MSSEELAQAIRAEVRRLIREELEALGLRPASERPEYLTVAEAAELLNRTEGAVRNLLNRGHLRRLGPLHERPVRIARSECERLLREGKTEAVEEYRSNGTARSRWDCALDVQRRAALSATTWSA